MRQWLRAGLLVLALAAAVVGFWALLAPQSFYDDFPGGGRTWVSVLPPYNDHLIRDVGGLNLALALLLGWAAVTLERPIVLAALVAALVYAVPHFVFHAANLEDLSTGDKVAQTVSLALALVLPLVLLVPAGLMGGGRERR
jgi:hypothetical protein